MSAAFGPGDRLLCVRSCNDDGCIVVGSVYTVHRLDRPFGSRPITTWECLCCGERDGPAVFLIEVPSSYGWCPCHFRPTWEDDATFRESMDVAEAMVHPPGQRPPCRIPTKEPA